MKRRKLFQNLFLATAACICLNGTAAFADADIFSDHEIYRDDNGNICIDFGEVQVYLPSDWSGLCQMSPSKDQVYFYQTK